MAGLGFELRHCSSILLLFIKRVPQPEILLKLKTAFYSGWFHPALSLEPDFLDLLVRTMSL